MEIDGVPVEFLALGDRAFKRLAGVVKAGVVLFPARNALLPASHAVRKLDLVLDVQHMDDGILVAGVSYAVGDVAAVAGTRGEGQVIVLVPLVRV